MSGPHALPGQSRDELAARIIDLSAQLNDLRAEVSELRGQLSAEVRTRSLAVVDDDGFERVVVDSREAFGAVSVYSRSAPGRTTCVELFANDAIDGDGAHVGLSITDDGEVVATLEVLHGHIAQLHFEHPAGIDERLGGQR